MPQYDPATGRGALDDATTQIATAAEDARGDRPDLAAVLDKAAAELRHSAVSYGAQVAFAQWSPRRACEALNAAGISAVLADVSANVDLPSGGQVRVVPAAQLDLTWTGYAVQVLDRAGKQALSLTATDDDDLTATVERLMRQTT